MGKNLREKMQMKTKEFEEKKQSKASENLPLKLEASQTEENVEKMEPMKEQPIQRGLNLNKPVEGKLFNKIVIQTIMRNCFGQIYGVELAKEMEASLSKALDRFEDRAKLNDKFTDNKENEAGPELDKCADLFSTTTLGSVGKEIHTSETLTRLAEYLERIGDLRLACECIWGAASLKLREFIGKHNLRQNATHDGNKAFTKNLSDAIYKEYLALGECHRAFYKNHLDREEMDRDREFKRLADFKELLDQFEFAKGQKEKMANKRFDPIEFL